MIEAMNETSQDSQTCCEGVRRPSWSERGRVCSEPKPIEFDGIKETKASPHESFIKSLIKERGEVYGPASVNLDSTASMWDAYLRNRNPGPLTIQDVCYMNILQKISRLARTPDHKDSLDDIPAYTELALENRQIAESVG